MNQEKSIEEKSTKTRVVKRIKIRKKPNQENKGPSISDEELEKKKKETQEKLTKYINQLDAKEKQAMEIAKNHLKTSFDLEKSIDFNNWSNKK